MASDLDQPTPSPVPLHDDGTRRWAASFSVGGGPSSEAGGIGWGVDVRWRPFRHAGLGVRLSRLTEFTLFGGASTESTFVMLGYTYQLTTSGSGAGASLDILIGPAGGVVSRAWRGSSCWLSSGDGGCTDSPPDDFQGVEHTIFGPSLFLGPSLHLGPIFIGGYASALAAIEPSVYAPYGYAEAQLGLRVGVSDW